MSRMYKENRVSLNWFVGCRHDCVYCHPSFQAQMKRQKFNPVTGRGCDKCYRYEPHAHPERLLKKPPKTVGDEFIFFPSSGDPTFASINEWATALKYIRKYMNTKFLIQSKNPGCFIGIDFPDNVILATTIETNQLTFDWFETHSKYRFYTQISQAPSPYARYLAMLEIKHKHKMVTIEPILDFNLATLIKWIREIHPEIVYVGYDNHNVKLPEPPLAKTHALIQELRKFTLVRIKSLRRAWWQI